MAPSTRSKGKSESESLSLDQEASSDSCFLCGEWNEPGVSSQQWISCDSCRKWFHFSCSGISAKEASIIKYFKCFLCCIEQVVSSQVIVSEIKEVVVRSLPVAADPFADSAPVQQKRKSKAKKKKKVQLPCL